MEVEYSRLDMIRILPQDIIDKILSALPIRDALRTSILSRNWRYCWTSIPVLTFDDKIFKGSSCTKEITKHKIVNAIFQVLLQHKSPLVEFTLWITLEMNSEFNQIILHLLKINTLKKLTLINIPVNFVTDYYKLPCLFFSFQGLQLLEISSFKFEPPSTFNGFTSLRWLCFYSVWITVKTLKRFLTNCPLLNCFYLIGYQMVDTRENDYTVAELFECLPSIKNVAISKYHMQYLAAGGTPLKLPISLVHLRMLYLSVCFMERDELSFTFCLINSSPNLKSIILKLQRMSYEKEFSSVNSLDLRDYSNFKLNHLEYLEMVSFSNLDIEKEFLKLIMAKSYVLKKVRIELGSNISVDEEIKMLRDYIRLPFPRASASAKLNFERPRKSIREIDKVIALLD